MKIKELQKTVNIAWSPVQQNPVYLVAGTAAQQLDSNANSTLEIYSPNFSDPSFDLELKASLPSQYRFQKIIWSPTGHDGAHRNGLIVGGCEGGHVMIYSASKILANEEGLIARQDKHTGPVSGLDVNPFQKNLLASCASESEIFIWDLNNTTTHMNPGAKTQPLEDVQNVAWNRQVQHILASVFSSRCVIWDLRKSEQIIKLSDTQSRVRWHAIQWHPDVATQVWLASEDDQAPVVQLWDLRYATAPAKTMQIHQRGVLGMSWCPRDTDLMVSCGKDNRIYCWNPNTEIPEGEILSEVATTATWYSDVQWCPRNPALIASSSLDGNVSIYSLFGGTQQQVQTSNKIADSFPGMDQFAQAPLPQQSTQIVYHDLKRAPKWLKPPCGVAFGFGGKLISFNGKSKSVNISQVVTEPQLVERANALEQSMNEANYAEYCRQRADQMTDQDGRYLWYFIKANFEMNPKEEMLNLLGYNKADVDNKFAKYIKEDATDTQDVDQLSNRISTLTHSDSSEVECDQSSDGSTDALQTLDNDAIFDGIAASQKQLGTDAEQKKPRPQFKIPSGDHPDSLITEALLTGNIEAAVELCIESKRSTEALIIASTAGIDFLTKIQNRFLQEQQTELSNVIGALVTCDWLDFVNRCTVDSWKSALMAALRHSERKAIDICERLGDRLMTECSNSIEYTRNAMLCYICAGSLDKLVTAWYQLKQLEHQNSNYRLDTSELQELAEVSMLMSKSLEQQGVAFELSGRFADFIAEYGGLLASQGALTAALTYIFSLGQSATGDLDDLRDRIYNAVHCRKPAPARGSLSHQHPQQQQPAANLYSRQQQQRGSFSQPGLQQPQFQPLQQQPQFQPNMWNAPAAAAAVPPPAVPTIFNPAVQMPQPIKPPQVAAEAQPPRPQSTASSQGGSAMPGVGAGAGGGLHSRSKYVLDPSVASAAPLGGYGGGGGGSGYATGAPVNAPISQNAFNTTPFNNSPLGGGIGALGSQPTTSIMQPNYNANAFGMSAPGSVGGNPYLPGVAPIETAAPVPPIPQNIQRNPTPPPGWNDPPALKSTRTSNYYGSNTNPNTNSSCRNGEMSARHAGTRCWQKIINHDTNSAKIQNPSSIQTSSSSSISSSYNTNHNNNNSNSNISNNNNNNSNNVSSNQPALGYHNAFSSNYSSPTLFQEFFQQPKVPETSNVSSPITHPLFGVDPNQNQNGYLDPNAAYQQQHSGMPPPPPAANAMQNNSYYNPNASMPQNNNNPPLMGGGGTGGGSGMGGVGVPTYQPQMNFQTSAIQNTGNQSGWNTQASHMGYTEQPATIQQQGVAPAQQQRQPEPPKEKPPLPEEYIYMQTVFEELKGQCLSAASDPRTKRKFVDVSKRLENLYDCLRDGRLTSATISSLNQIVQYIQIGDYANALQTHTQIAFGSDFSQCAGFMPGLKVLVQSAADLQVYLR